MPRQAFGRSSTTTSILALALSETRLTTAQQRVLATQKTEFAGSENEREKGLTIASISMMTGTVKRRAAGYLAIGEARTGIGCLLGAGVRRDILEERQLNSLAGREA